VAPAVTSRHYAAMKKPPAGTDDVLPVPDSFTEYESGFIDGYMMARGILEPSPREFQRALAGLKKSREQAAAQAARSTQAEPTGP
jgi:hypothetical protein